MSYTFGNVILGGKGMMNRDSLSWKWYAHEQGHYWQSILSGPAYWIVWDYRAYK